jgi:hypothetical protein
MLLRNSTAERFIPDGSGVDVALGRTTHLAIAAHADDVELMALHGVLACFGRADAHFAACVVTDGAGAPRSGPYASCTDAEMRAIRRAEQKKAAVVGEYAALLMLDYSSRAVREGAASVVDDLTAILLAAQPRVVYTHTLADRHDTHVAVALRAVAALRRLPPTQRPERVYGCEVWRDLDWLTGDDRVALDVSDREHLAAALLGVHDSQIAGGKRYDLAAQGRRRANATFAESHATDESTGLTLAMDLTPLVRDDSLDVGDFVAERIGRFAEDVAKKLREHR